MRTTKNRCVSIHLQAGLAFCLTSLASAGVSYTDSGSSYAQNFNSLPNVSGTYTWSNDGTLTGWYALKEDGTAFTQLKPADGSASVTAYLLSCGVFNDSEHALGHQSQTTAGDYMFFGLRLINSTGKTLTEFALAFTGEQWRRVSGDTDRLDFAYQVFAPGAGSLTASSGWTDVDTLDFIAPNNTGASAKLDGNSAANRVALSDTVKGLSWEDGKELWLRWSDRNGPTNRHMMAIDDVTFSAQPDQGTVVMVR